MPETIRDVLYDDQFYNAQEVGSLNSARTVVPIVLEIVQPRSVVDFGCGRATWLKAFLENGVEVVRGLDGPYVEREKLLIDAKDFLGVDLTGPIHLEHRFDLALCLEVAEHLPTRYSRNLVRSLVAAAPVVVFSAAIPGQHGTHHVNEQWPLFWEKIFAESGYKRIDLIRPKIWGNTRVESWYRQNIYIYASEESYQKISREYDCAHSSFDPDLEVISSAVFSNYQSLGGLLKETARLVVRKLRNRFIKY